MSRYFWPIFTPSPVTLCHTSRDPPKVRHTSRTSHFSGHSTKNLEQKPIVQILSQLFARIFVRGVCQGVFCLEGFVRGDFCPFPLLSEYICYNRKLNITLNFLCHMSGNFFISVTSHALEPPPLSQTVTPSRTPSPLERDILYGRPPSQSKEFIHIYTQTHTHTHTH